MARVWTQNKLVYATVITKKHVISASRLLRTQPIQKVRAGFCCMRYQNLIEPWGTIQYLTFVFIYLVKIHTNDGLHQNFFGRDYREYPQLTRLCHPFDAICARPPSPNDSFGV